MKLQINCKIYRMCVVAIVNVSHHNNTLMLILLCSVKRNSAIQNQHWLFKCTPLLALALNYNINLHFYAFKKYSDNNVFFDSIIKKYI